MDGAQYDDRDFFRAQQQDERCWKWPLSLAVLLHLVVFASSIWLPDLINHHPLLDDIVTVDLVSLPEPESAPPAPVPAAPVVQPPEPVVTAPPPPPEPEPAEVALAPEIKPEAIPEPVAPAKPISLTPRKRKVKKAKDTRLAEEKEQEKRQKIARLEQQKRKKEALARKLKAQQARKRAAKLRRQRALADARRAQQEAERAAAVARAELAAVIRQSGARAGRTDRPGSSSGRKVQSAVLNQYLSSLYDRVHGYWILPEMRQWDPRLETIVVLTIRRDGSVQGMQIERKSKDPYFDQFVMKTLRSAAPMPRFPALMSQSSIEVGLRFKPGELAM